MKSILLSVVLMFVIGCSMMETSSTSTGPTKNQIAYKWSQIPNYLTKKRLKTYWVSLQIYIILKMRRYGSMSTIMHAHLALSVSVEATIVYGLSQNHHFNKL